MNWWFLKTVGQSSAVNIVSATLLFTLSILLARTMGPAGFGAYSFALSIIGLVVLIAQLGFPGLTVREVSKHIHLRRFRLLRRYLRYSNWVIIAMSLSLIVALALVLILFGPTFISNWQVILAGLPLVLLFPQIAQAAAVLRGAGRVVQSLIGQQVYRPALLLTFVCIALLTKAPITSVTVMAMHGVASAIVVLELRLRLARALPELGRPLQVSRNRIAAWTGAAVMFSGVAVVQLVNTKFDIIAIGFLMNDADVGLYAVAVQLSYAASMILMITAVVVQPAISRAAAERNNAEVERQCYQSALLSFSASLIILILAAIFGKWLIEIAFGPAYVGVWPSLMVLIGGQVANSFFGPVGVLLNMRGQERLTLAVTFVASLVNVSMNFALIPVLGLVGAALGTVTAMIGWNIVLWIAAWRIWGINASALSWPRYIDPMKNS